MMARGRTVFFGSGPDRVFGYLVVQTDFDDASPISGSTSRLASPSL